MPFHPGLQGNGGDDGLDFKFAKGKEGKKMSDFKMLPFKDASLGSQALTATLSRGTTSGASPRTV